MEHSTDTTGAGLPGPDDDGRIDEKVEESFPASDPPSGWAGEDPRDLLGLPERPGPRDGDGPPDA